MRQQQGKIMKNMRGGVRARGDAEVVLRDGA
jgi:hypothetical protein